jgi:hypothetical protein
VTDNDLARLGARGPRRGRRRRGPRGLCAAAATRPGGQDDPGAGCRPTSYAPSCRCAAATWVRFGMSEDDRTSPGRRRRATPSLARPSGQGQFRARPTRPRGPNHRRRPFCPSAGRWAPAEPVLPVVGCVGQAGATTWLSRSPRRGRSPRRVMECCSATASGLSAAATAELGRHDNDWTWAGESGCGSPEASEVLLGPSETPLPDWTRSSRCPN